MGRVAAAGDNAAMESFFSLLQKNVLNTRRWATRDDLRIAIVTWIQSLVKSQEQRQRVDEVHHSRRSVSVIAASASKRRVWAASFDCRAIARNLVASKSARSPIAIANLLRLPR